MLSLWAVSKAASNAQPAVRAEYGVVFDMVTAKLADELVPMLGTN